MSLPAFFTAEARDELIEAYLWYQAQRDGLGADFLREISNLLALVSERPQMFPEGYRRTRRGHAKRFPYGIVFRVESTRIIVIAVHHWSRNPRRWKRR